MGPKQMTRIQTCQMARGPVAGRLIWQRASVNTSVVQDDAAPRDDNVVLDDVRDVDATPRGDEPSGLEADNEVEEIESLPTGVIPPNADDEDQNLPRERGDLEAVCSRDFQDTAREARTMRRSATHKPKLNSCDACRRAKALRAKHVRSLEKAENRIRKSRGPLPEKFGDQVTLDHIVARNEHKRGFKGQTSALTLMDRATGLRWGRGLRQKTGRANLEVMRKF
jgi:hypothetical protein